MAERRYSKTHEWCALDGGVATCGISRHAADQLNDLTFLDYRVAVGDSIAQGGLFGEVDSVKATSELYAPVSGEVVELNERFRQEDELATITQDPEGAGWLIKIRVSDPAQAKGLLDAAAYQAHCAADAH